jgi:hypothetical protein
MRFYIDTAGVYAGSHFTTPKPVSSRTRSRYYKALTGYACAGIELPAILSSILSGTLTLLPVSYFPAPIPKSFKWFDAPLTAALALTTSLRSILMLRTSPSPSFAFHDVEWQKQCHIKIVLV